MLEPKHAFLLGTYTGIGEQLARRVGLEWRQFEEHQARARR